MLLAIDIGNSNVKFGVFDGDNLTSKFSFRTIDLRPDLDLGVGDQISSAIACSVVPDLNERVADLIEQRFGVTVFLVTNDLDFGLHINYEPLEAIGTDRIVNCFSAVEKYGPPVIVCSFGTATTIDAVNTKRELLGGLIAPGMRTAAKALHANTAKLPEAEVKNPQTIINRTTDLAIQAGLFFGQVGLVETTTGRIRNEIGHDARVIATGGSAKMIAAECDVIDLVDENLLLDGLSVLHNRSRSLPIDALMANG